MANANASLDMMDEVEVYDKLRKQHEKNRHIMDSRHESFPDREADDIVQDDPEFMSELDDITDAQSDNTTESDNNSGESESDTPMATVMPHSSVATANRNVWGKHFPKIYSKGLKAVSGLAYKKWVEPKELYEERDALFKTIGTDAFTKEKQARYKFLETELKEWKTRRAEVLDAANIDDEDARAIGELSADIMAAKGKEIQPGMLLLILLLAPVFNVLMISVTHVFAYKVK